MSLLTWARHCPCLYLAAGHHSRPVVDGHGWFGWLWFIFVCGWPSLFVGGWLHFLGGRGGGAVVGGCWCPWAITKAVVVKSMVGGGDEHGWWW